MTFLHSTKFHHGALMSALTALCVPPAWASGLLGSGNAQFEQQVEAVYQISTLTPDHKDIASAGTAVVLKNGMFLSCKVGSCAAARNTLVVGELTSIIGEQQNPAFRKFYAGTKFWVIGTLFKPGHLYVALITDPVDGARYGGLIDVLLQSGSSGPTPQSALNQLESALTPLVTEVAGAGAMPISADASSVSPGTGSAESMLKFDVAGVRLGMSPAEARNALAAHYHVKPETIRIPGQGGLIYQASGHAMDGNDQVVSVDFAPSDPTDLKSPPAVLRVSYRVGMLANVSSESVMKAAVEKYGTPSEGNAASFGGPQWCSRADGAVLHGHGCGGAAIVLKSITSLDLTLENSAANAAWQATERAAAARKPTF